MTKEEIERGRILKQIGKEERMHIGDKVFTCGGNFIYEGIIKAISLDKLIMLIEVDHYIDDEKTLHGTQQSAIVVSSSLLFQTEAEAFEYFTKRKKKGNIMLNLVSWQFIGEEMTSKN